MTAKPDLTLHVEVTGRVQGVGYRYWIQHAARKLRISGWIRNCADGSVEGVFQGPEEDLRALLAECKSGPPRASVTAVKTTPGEYDGPADFVIEP